ncbi:hypothetical protein [Haloarchaeobius sp. HME9146]|uniref:hypothetical protein n=1 Tax=Haloarchaeobius sp. HME9146 TaxID=2978732 RepID=UPI0021C020D8|nr:hypothetical protein [Haloarchaeobius sp. HME9146]MCT9096641.1 hypothetical protein [Haloarchaeobius sp. HME9146]
MTLVVVLADPPREGLVLPRLAEETPLSAEDAADCYRAMLADTLFAAAESGGELLVNYRDEDLLPDEFSKADGEAEAEVRAVAADALGSADETRFEVQVGSTYDGRVGNTVTHLLDREDHASVLVLDGTAPLAGRKDIDNASMKLRRSDVVLGPASDGRVWGSAFCEPIDFDGAFASPVVETLTARARDADLEVDFLPNYETVETGDDLCSVVSILRARRRAGRIVPPHTTEFIEDRGLTVVADDGDLELVRE